MHERTAPGSRVPVVATALAVCALAAPFWPVLFPFVLAGGAAAACALVLVRRASRPLVLAVAGVALWLAVGLAGAWLLRARGLAGFAWVVGSLFVLPLPLIPFLYSRTFAEPSGRAPVAETTRGRPREGGGA